jgi:hypothetical protein
VHHQSAFVASNEVRKIVDPRTATLGRTTTDAELYSDELHFVPASLLPAFVYQHRDAAPSEELKCGLSLGNAAHMADAFVGV